MTRNSLSTSMLALLTASVFGVHAGAQTTLALDNQSAVVKPLGSMLEFTITGPAGEAAVLLVDRDPGPTTVFGQSLAVGFTPELSSVPLGTIPGSGTLTLNLRVPREDDLHGQTLYFAVVAVDPSASSGLAFSNGASVTFAARPQLAGNPLTERPFFENVAAINRGSPVSIALPTRFVFASGRAADIYVVASKSSTQWAADPSLVDVRGTPQAVTFPVAANSIQQQTYLLDAGALAGPDESPGSGDTRIGVGYDVVIDFGQDGNFDDGVDLIDGHDENEAGFYVVRDTVRGGTATAPGNGPYAVTEIQYTGGSFLGQDLYYPSNIASLGQLPVVVVSHGNGHDYRWYDHIGYHIASYGYVVMSHQNETVPGSHTAGVTTLRNTDFLLGNLATIGGGVLNGHVDTGNIVWIGHSRGGDGVARAYDQLVRGSFPVTNYSIQDIKLISSIAPVDFGGFSGGGVILGGANNGSNPHGANFHLWVAQADADVHGCSSSEAVQWYHLHERATGKRQSTSLYGVGHGDYHDGGGSSVASGPNLIGRANTHNIMRGYLLPLIEHHIRGDIPSRDFLWRQYESFRPVTAPVGANVIANLMFQDDRASGKYVIDDFQDLSAVNPALATSRASVTKTVTEFTEGRAEDCDTVFTNSINDPFNGFTHDDYEGAGHFRSESFASVFSFDGSSDMEIVYDMTTAIARPDFREFAYLSFRAAQGTRHPLTTASLADLTFSVALEDASGVRSPIHIGAYGGGLEDPYQRNTGPACGTGNGWNSEYETIRIRLTDFLNDSDLSLGSVAKVVFLFGPSHGSAQGRIALDEIELSTF